MLGAQFIILDADALIFGLLPFAAVLAALLTPYLPRLQDVLLEQSICQAADLPRFPYPPLAKRHVGVPKPLAGLLKVWL